MEENYNISDDEIYGVIENHLKKLNRELEDTHKGVQNALIRMQEMDNEQIKYPWYRSMN